MEKYIKMFGLLALAIVVVILLVFILLALVSVMLIIGTICLVLWVAVVVFGESNDEEDK